MITIIKVGLTGGIACGKSYVARKFIESGIVVVDCDVIAHNLLSTNKVKNFIREEYGSQFFDDNNNLNRRQFGIFIFKDKLLKAKYDSFIIPLIKEEIEKLFKSTNKLLVVDGATIVEHNLQNMFDILIGVTVSDEIQLKRIIERDKLSNDEAISRINSQLSKDEKMKHCNYIIDTTNNADEDINNLINILKGLINE